MGGLPPTNLKGQSQNTAVTTFSFQTPLNQATQIAGVKSLIETGNTNLLSNPGFEGGTVSWTASGGSFSATTTTANIGTGAKAGDWDSSSAAQTLSATSITIPAGLYATNGVAKCNIQTPSGTATHTLDVTDGTNVLASTVVTSSTTYQYTSTNFVFPSSGSIVLRLSSVASNEPEIFIDDCYIGTATNTSQIYQSPSLWSGYHDSTCSFARTNTAYGDPTADATCALVQRQNVNFGSVVTASSAGSALPGIVFTPNIIGQYMICAMSYAAPNITAVAATLGIQLVDNSSAQVSESVESGLVSTDYQSFPNCTLLNIGAITSQTIKLQTKASAGTVTLGGNGGSAVEWTIMQVSPQTNMPQITNSVASPATNGVKLASAKIANPSGTCSVSTQDGTWISSVSHPATGACTINYSTFSVAPVCQCTCSDTGASGLFCNVRAEPSTSTAAFRCFNTAGSGVDSNMYVTCVGAK